MSEDTPKKEILYALKPGEKSDAFNSAIENAQGVQREQYKNTAIALGSLIRALYSETDAWPQVKEALLKYTDESTNEPIGKIFIQKLQLAFVWYYLMYLKKEGKLDESKTYQNESKAKAGFKPIKDAIEREDPLYQLYADLLGGSIHQFPETPFNNGAIKEAHDFLWDLYTRGGGKESANDVLSDDDFELALKDVKVAEKTDETIETLKKLRKKLNTEAGKSAGLSVVLSMLLCLADSPDNKVFYYGKLGDKSAEQRSKVNNEYNALDDEQRKIADMVFKQSPFENNEQVLNTVENREKIISLVKDVLKKVKDGSDKENVKESTEGSFEDQLALNMANYITGRISSKEFLRIDRRIRDSQPLHKDDQLLNETE